MGNITSGDVDFSKLIGSTVKIMSACTTQGWIDDASKTYVIEDIAFRIAIDGKTFTIIKLVGLPDNTFTWKDLKLISLNNG